MPGFGNRYCAMLFAVATLAIGFSYWQLPYNRIALPHSLLDVGMVLVVVNSRDSIFNSPLLPHGLRRQLSILSPEPYRARQWSRRTRFGISSGYWFFRCRSGDIAIQ
jgi:hypothetical protein